MRGRGLAVVDGAWVRRGCVALLAVTLTLLVACTHDNSDPWTFDHDAGVPGPDAAADAAPPADAMDPQDVPRRCTDGVYGIEWATVSSIEELWSLEGCTLFGTLNIHCDTCTDLAPLSQLTEVSGDIWFGGNTALTSLAGLENLTSVGGALWIGSPPRYPPLSNPALTSLQGLEGLRTVGGWLFVGGSPLTSLDGLNSLESVEQLTIAGSDVADLCGLESLASAEHVYIDHNESLTSMEGLESLTSLGSLTIDGNESLTSLAGLENLTSLGSLRIASNLTSLHELQGVLGELRYLELNGNAFLTSLTGLEGVTHLPDGLVIDYNNSLTSLAGLENLTSVGSLHVWGNMGLGNCEVCALIAQLAEPVGDLDIYGNHFDICTPAPDHCPPF